MKAFKKNKKKIKKWAKPFDVLLCSEKLMRTAIKTMGKALVKLGKTPIPIRSGDKIEDLHEKLKNTVKFQLKKVIDL
jgi:ribosomal protein L1